MSKKNKAVVASYNNGIMNVDGEDVVVTDVTEGRDYRNNGKVWLYEIQDNNRWIPAVTQTFRTRDEARVFVAGLRNTGMNVRIAKYELTGFDRF